MPGSFEGETVTRRRFMPAVTHSAGGVAAMAFTLPALGFALGPLFSREPFSWQPIGKPEDFAGLDLRDARGDDRPGHGRGGQLDRLRPHPQPGHRHRARRTSTTTGSRCPRAACTSAARSASSTRPQRFICPCHGGVYDFRGMVAGGPPVRPLDRFYTRLNSNTGHGRDRPPLLGQLRADALLAARPRPAAGRHRSISVPEALLDTSILPGT